MVITNSDHSVLALKPPFGKVPLTVGKKCSSNREDYSADSGEWGREDQVPLGERGFPRGGEDKKSP